VVGLLIGARLEHRDRSVNLLYGGHVRVEDGDERRQRDRQHRQAECYRNA
jgi:hypothetical protein